MEREEREEEATEVEGRTAGVTIQVTSLVLQGGASLGSVARVETPGTSQAGAIAAGRQAGGALTTTWTATAATWSAGAGEGIPSGMRAWMQPSRSSP